MASSPPFVDSEDVDQEDTEPEVKMAPPTKKPQPVEDDDSEARFARLSFLLQKSSLYANMLKDQMDRAREKQAAVAAQAKPKSKPRSMVPGRGPARGTGRLRVYGKRARVDSGDEEEDKDSEDAPNAKRAKVVPPEDTAKPIFVQPALLTGATLKDYQLEGVAWMVSLWENGISGILADEMGLGKTIQTIAFIAYLRVRVESPFLIVCPLSVLHNWMDEFKKFAPDINVCMYHGTPQERAQLRRTAMALPVDRVGATANSKSRGRPSKNGKSKVKHHSRKVKKPDSDSEHEDDEVFEAGGEPVPESDLADSTEQKSTFPIIVTTYEMVIKDRLHLAKYKWGYIVVDEGHRLKNMDCLLMREVKKYTSAGRMVLTGTPLHNNLGELWSLLNFILPDIFDDVDSFQEWFNLPTLSTSLGSDRSTQVLNTLHSILKPFLLRRVKTDVERSLPPKKEYVLYAPLSEKQRELYDAVVRGGLRTLLIGDEPDDKADAEATDAQPEEEEGKSSRKLRKRDKKKYDVDGNDDEYFKRLENGQVHGIKQRDTGKNTAALGRDHAYKTRVKNINNMHLQMPIMQLRKVCSHPFLFDWPLDKNTKQPVINEDLVNASGKMMVLERLLDELFRRGHKVLVFSQFKTMLDVIEDWATEYKHWPLCRIDGASGPLERREEMNRFQNGGDNPNAPRLFLLSTRAGGLGINLTAADTVIFYDQDWNPQMDLQAQDRAHRIGQTRPVLIFRLVSKHTIENSIMQRASEKRQLEALVIAKGKFKMPAHAAAKTGKQETIAEMATSLIALEGQKIEVVPSTDAGKANIMSDEELDVLLDRRPEVFEGRGVGWTSGKAKDEGMFAVYEAPADEGNDVLAMMMGEEV